jgi:hypothetical protein
VFNGVGEPQELALYLFEDGSFHPPSLVGQAVEDGLTWARVNLDHGDFHEDWQEQTGQAPWSEFQIYPEQEQAMSLYHEDGVRLVYIFSFWDEEIEPHLDDPG